jgi:hypothetical protein
MNSLGWMTFCAFHYRLTLVFDADFEKIHMLNYFIPVVFIPINFVAIWAIEKKGLRSSLIAAIFIQTISFWLKYHSFKILSLSTLYFSQFLFALGFPFIWNMPEKLAHVWFPA